MAFIEDRLRLRQIFSDVSDKDISAKLKKVPLKNSNLRCEQVTCQILSLQDETNMKSPKFLAEIEDDFRCIRHVLKCASDEEIRETLHMLGTLNNRKYATVRILLHQRGKLRTKHCKRKELSDGNGGTGRYKNFGKLENGHHSASGSETNSDIINLDDDNCSLLSSNSNSSFTSKSRPSSRMSQVIVLDETVTNPESEDDNMELRNIEIYTESRQQIQENQMAEIPEIAHPNYSVRVEQNEPTSIFKDNVFHYGEHSGLNTNNTLSFSDYDKLKKREFFNNNNNNSSQRLLDYSNKKLRAEAPAFQPITQPSNKPATIVKDEENNDNDLDVLEEGKTEIDHENAKDTLSINSATSTNLKRKYNFRNHDPSSENNPVPKLINKLVSSEVSITPVAVSNNCIPSTSAKADKPLVVDEKLFLKIIEMFPIASPDYIRTLCDGKVWSNQAFDEIVDIILSNENYPQRPKREPSPETEVDQEEQIQMLEEMLPNADPTYLRAMVFKFAGDNTALREFINEAMENNSYPTRKEYLRKQQISAQQKQYTTDFNVENFVQLFNDPVAYFENPNRVSSIIDLRDKSYVKTYMRNRYRRLSAKTIDYHLSLDKTPNIMTLIKILDGEMQKGSTLRTCRGLARETQTQNIPLLQELAYVTHKEEIVQYLENKRIQDEVDRKNAKELNLLQTCACCFDEEVMPKDILECTGGCRFCRECVKKGTEVAFSDGKLEFACLANCGNHFSLQTLQNAVSSNVFSKIAQKKALAEVKAAGIEDLETCPFCEFATIPPPGDRHFQCLNPDCMKESCRLCKEMSHVPLRCDEVEKDEAVQARTYIENKMTEALIRECWKCKNKFIKEEGCNKMTCSCGASMCYICRQPVKDYKHFNGQGGDRLDLCPLYSDNFEVNEANVIKAAKQAKMEVDPKILKQDPTSDLMEHFGDKVKKIKTAQIVRQGVMRVHQEQLHPDPFRQIRVRTRVGYRNRQQNLQNLAMNLQQQQQRINAIAHVLAIDAEEFNQRGPPYRD